ncbi:condensation domain-containing protein, partial [Streptomyces shenzhenensis]|uniref:hypothetical protein n=1 Tax=Streptomyces shenzhenensis TaxID=943815 RepID=UPI0015F0769B
RRQLAELMVHEHAPLALAQAASGLPGGTPLFSSIFNYRHNPPVEQRAGARLEGVTPVMHRDRTNYPLSAAVDDDGSGFGLVVEALPDVDPDRVCALLHTCLDNVVTALEGAPETRLAEVDVLDAAGRGRLVDGWSGTEVVPARSGVVPEWFAVCAVS